MASALDHTGASAVRNVITRIITIREGPQWNCYRHRSVTYFQRGNKQPVSRTLACPRKVKFRENGLEKRSPERGSRGQKNYSDSSNPYSMENEPFLPILEKAYIRLFLERGRSMLVKRKGCSELLQLHFFSISSTHTTYRLKSPFTLPRRKHKA